VKVAVVVWLVALQGEVASESLLKGVMLFLGNLNILMKE
jgi:hypothetical protein